MPKLCLLLVPAIQLAVTMTVRAVLGAQMKKSPALAGVPRVLSAVVAVVCLVLEACVLLTAWGAALPVEGVLLAALVLGGLCVLGRAHRLYAPGHEARGIGATASLVLTRSIRFWVRDS